MDFDDSLTQLKGIGEKSAERFGKIGITTIADLIEFYPRTYDSLQPPARISDIADGQIVAVCGHIAKTLSVRRAGRFQITTGLILTDTERIPVTWFNMPYLRGQVTPGITCVFRGYAKQKGRQMTLAQPKIYTPAEYEEKSSVLQPVYPLTRGLNEKTLRKAIAQALDMLDLTRDYLPEDIRKNYHLSSIHYAYHQIHFPADLHECVLARQRLVFDEFLLFILALRQWKQNKQVCHDAPCLHCFTYAEKLLSSLPYELTGAQKKVWEQVKHDMSLPNGMARLIQGDVGSGKTIVAFLALVSAAENHLQGALMVPTEVLARQHYQAFTDLAGKAGLPLRCALLTGSMKAGERRETLRQIENGDADVIIGTHALFQDKVAYHELGLVIADEQHRFGVKQREALLDKGHMPHFIVMSATPIPRTLAVILYSDLDVSVIDELPAGRQSIRNCVVDPSYRSKAYRFIEKEISSGHQAYVICPMVEESDLMEAENVVDYTAQLRRSLGDAVAVEYLHGKMKPQEKTDIMQRFVNGEIQVLVSTTVVEVGVNVPNATVMMIEDAQRFGLAQLHQLRGRVGRGNAPSYCILIDSSGKEETNARLQIMNRTNDGFEIARRDLELRGPGDLFGIRQSGLIDFAIADVFQDAAILQYANEAAGRILSEDGTLSTEKYRLLRQKLHSSLQHEPGYVNI